MEHSFTVDSKDAGQRIDKWLCRKLPKLSRKQIKALIDAGRVRINSKRVVIASWELEEADSVEVRALHHKPRHEEPWQKATEQPKHKEPPSHKGKGHSKIGASIERHLERKRSRTAEDKIESRQKMEERRAGALKVYYEDRDVIVVEKPAGILSVPNPGQKGADTLQGRIKKHLKRRYKQSRSSFVSPLHRLDVETSGIMVFALSKAGQRLSRQFKNHSISRAYQAIVNGRIEKEKGIIDKALEKGSFGHGKKVRQSHKGSAKRAITEYRVKERYKKATLLDINVRTGRTHQIRVHLSSFGHPIIGDSTYSDKHAKSELCFRRHALHAHSLSFKHPASGKKISHRSTLPADMKDLIDKLREES